MTAVAHSLDWHGDPAAKACFAEIVAAWTRAPGRLAVHGLEVVDGALLLFTDPEPEVGVVEATVAARSLALPDRAAWACARTREIARALEGFPGPHRDVGRRSVAFDDDGRAVIYPPVARVTVNRAVTGQARRSPYASFEALSPELVRGMAIDRASDVYQLGILLRGLLGAPRPFGDGDDMATLSAVMAPERPPRLAEVGLDVPRELDELVAQMLAYAPEDRPATPEVLAEGLAPFADADRGRAEVARAARAVVLEARAKRFRFESRFDASPVITPCAKRWDELQVTGDPKVRSCDACRLTVTRVETEGQLLPLAGRCVFLDPRESR